MQLRPANFNDWQHLLKWRNDPIARLNSFDQDIISEDIHKKWFKASLLNKQRKILIMEDSSGVPIGTIRSDTNSQNEEELSWNISPDHRGKGLGGLMLSLFFKNTHGKFVAKIKKENIASIKIAESNGFAYSSPGVYIKTL